MDFNEMTIPIFFEASLAFIFSITLILDVLIHGQIKNYQLELGLLLTNMLESIGNKYSQKVTILLFVQLNSILCLSSLFLVQCFTLSSFLWTILILQKGCLLTRYPPVVALEYLKTNQFILQALIAFGLPIIASSLIFINNNICSIETLPETSTKLFWAIQAILSIIFIGIATYHIVKIHLFSRLVKLYSYILYCPLMLLFTFPWAVTTTFNLNLEQSLYVYQALFLLKNSQILLSTILFAYNSGCQVVFVENACPVQRIKYLAKYQHQFKSTSNVEIGLTTLQTQLLIK